MFFCRLPIFSKSIFQKILSGMPSVCQTVWIQIRPDILSGLIWVQTVCKGYQQMTLSRQWVNSTSLFSPPKIVFIGPDIIILKMAQTSLVFKRCVVSYHLNHLNKAYDLTEHTFILWNAAWYGVTINSHRIKLPLNPQSNFYVRKGIWSHQSSAVVCYILVCIVCAR